MGLVLITCRFQRFVERLSSQPWPGYNLPRSSTTARQAFEKRIHETRPTNHHVRVVALAANVLTALNAYALDCLISSAASGLEKMKYFLAKFSVIPDVSF